MDTLLGHKEGSIRFDQNNQFCGRYLAKKGHQNRNILLYGSLFFVGYNSGNSFYYLLRKCRYLIYILDI